MDNKTLFTNIESVLMDDKKLTPRSALILMQALATALKINEEDKINKEDPKPTKKN